VSTARSIAFSVGVAVLTVLVANHLFAIPVWWAVALSLPLAAVVLLALLLSGVADPNWEPVPAPVSTPAELHASTLAARFAEAAEDQHRFTSRVQPRLRRIAIATLRGRPGTRDLTSLDDPRARDVLGADLHRLLTDSQARLPDPGRLAALLDRLEGS
jgi:hypothetical protein